MLEFGFPEPVSGDVGITIIGSLFSNDMGTGSGSYYTYEGGFLISQPYSYFINHGGPSWPLEVLIGAPGQLPNAPIGGDRQVLEAATADSGGSFAVTATVSAIAPATTAQSLYLTYADNSHYGSPWALSIYAITYSVSLTTRLFPGPSSSRGHFS